MLVINILFILFFSENYTLAKDNLIRMETSKNSKLLDVKVINKEIPDKDLFFYGLVIGKSKLSDVGKIFKKGEVISSGDAGKNISFICYILPDHDEVIYFKSGEMGGENKIITSVTLRKRNLNQIESQKCLVVKGFSKLAVWPGMKKMDIIKLKGQPSKYDKDSLIYYYQTEKQTTSGLLDVSSSAEYYFKNNELLELNISKVESY